MDTTSALSIFNSGTNTDQTHSVDISSTRQWRCLDYSIPL